MNSSKVATHISLFDALEKGPPPEGNLAIPVFNHGSMEAELYTPSENDPQKPHTRDEIYLVARGSSNFFNGEKNLDVEEG
jgi:hypothetical protein